MLTPVEWGDGDGLARLVTIKQAARDAKGVRH
jgi:hypothetical protein